MKRMITFCIHIYQKIPGPWHQACRHIPTCSNYALEAIETHGAIKGSYLSIKRLLRCNPFGSQGYDPGPQKGRRK